MYAVAYQLTSNLLVLWPLLTPLGSFHANVEAREVDLPWASIAGFLDVAAVMITVLVVAHGHQRRARLAVAGTTPRHISPPAATFGDQHKRAAANGLRDFAPLRANSPRPPGH